MGSNHTVGFGLTGEGTMPLDGLPEGVVADGANGCTASVAGAFAAGSPAF